MNGTPANTAIKLQVAAARQEESGQGIARLPKSTFSALGITEGDVVEIAGKRNTAARAVVAYAEDEGLDDDPEDADIVAQIRELIETRVRPAVANDGGDIIYRGFQKGVVYLQMQGACSGCPSSTATLKHGIEGLLKHYVPEVTEVRAA